MKKFLATTCAMTMLVSSHSMEGKYFLKKTWAYTKMGFGVLAGCTSLYNFSQYPWNEYHVYKEKEQELYKKIGETSDFGIQLPNGKSSKDPKQIAQFLLNFGKRGREITRNRQAPMISYLLIAILSWQSGRRDLKDIRELNEKEAAAQPAADNAN